MRIETRRSAARPSRATNLPARELRPAQRGGRERLPLDSQDGGAARRRAAQPHCQSPYPLSKIYIENGFFYTHKLATNFFFEKVKAGAGGAGAARSLRQRVRDRRRQARRGRGQPPHRSVGDREESHTLKRVDGLPYRL